LFNAAQHAIRLTREHKTPSDKIHCGISDSLLAWGALESGAESAEQTPVDILLLPLLARFPLL